jgi:hypothetical protein
MNLCECLVHAILEAETQATAKITRDRGDIGMGDIRLSLVEIQPAHNAEWSGYARSLGGNPTNFRDFRPGQLTRARTDRHKTDFKRTAATRRKDQYYQ